MSFRELSINLVSNASMTTFPENTLSHFTTLLPQQLNLSGFLEVALVEIAWPAAIQNNIRPVQVSRRSGKITKLWRWR